MKETIQIDAQSDYSTQWVKLVRLYKKKRGSDAGRSKQAIPRTTNDDVRQLTRWWHGEYQRELRRDPWIADRSKASRKEWLDCKRKIDSDLENADPAALYPDNEWFWDRATRRLSLYLSSRKIQPSEIELFFDAVKETVEERIEDLGDLADVGDDLWSDIKKGLYIAGGVVAAAIVLPPIVRALTDSKEN